MKTGASGKNQSKMFEAIDSAADAAAGKVAPAEHLVVLVNGIVGSADNWVFAAAQFRERFPDNVLVHCSICNSATRTFHGVDVMGKRLADEVQEVVDRTPGVSKISFVAHSLGGLIARYAIAQLVRQEVKDGQPRVTMAGLEPMNFVTLATPHLGSRGSRQLPFLFGIKAFETLAPQMAHWFIGQTGKHLFLTDGNASQQPLLRRMATDCEEGKFITALRSFKQRAVYANVSHDHLVGWRTGSIRREWELPEVGVEAVSDKYPHVVRVEEVPPVQENGSDANSESLPGQEEQRAVVDPVEEEMVSGLCQVPWRRVDISFKSASSPFAAHNTIQVKQEARHSEGAGIITHILDNFCL